MSSDSNKPKFGKANDTNNAFVKLKEELKEWNQDRDPNEKFITPLKFQASHHYFKDYEKKSFRHPFYVARQAITGEKIPAGSKQYVEEEEGTK